VVSYNSTHFLARLAQSLRTSDRIASVTIVDNHSSDDSVKLAESLNWGAPHFVVPLQENVGFGAAMNRGAFAPGRLGSQILIVNPDVSVGRETLGVLSDNLIRTPNLAAVGAVLRTETGLPVSSARDFPSPHTIARRIVREVDHGGAFIEADWICGALMLWDRQAFIEVDGFSSDYFLYYEDVDACQKARASGWSIMIDGSQNAIHDQGHGNPTSQLLRRAARTSRRRYARKWYGPRGAISAFVADSIDFAAAIYHKLRGR